MFLEFIVYIIAGLGAGIGTGLAGLSAAAVISPMLITFLGFPAYEAVGIALASDVLASAASAYTYGKNKNIDIKMVHYLTNAMENQWISHSLPDYLLEASLVYLNLMKMKIRSWTVVQVISRKKVLHTRLLIKKIKQRIRSKRMEHQKL